MSFTLLNKTTPMARKRYRCFWCYQFIELKEVHVQYAGVFDGDFSSTRMHSECYTAMLTMGPELDDGFMPGEFKRGTTEEK